MTSISSFSSYAANSATPNASQRLQNLKNEISKLVQKFGISTFCGFRDVNSKKTWAIIKMDSPNARYDFLSKIGKHYGVRLSPCSGSSVGILHIGGLSIGAKPETAIGKARGASNEIRCTNILKKCIGESILEEPSGRKEIEPVDITFMDGRKSFTCWSVTDVECCSKDVSGNKKADIILYSEPQDKKYYISLKQDDADNWESIDKKAKKTNDERYSEIGRTFDAIHQIRKGENGIESSLLEQDSKDGKWMFKQPYTSGVAWKPSKRLAYEAVFGSDIKSGCGCIIKKTFQEGYEVHPKRTAGIKGIRKTAVIEVSKIFTSMKDIQGTDFEPWIHVRNDKSRNAFFSNGMRFKGIRANIATRKRVWGIGCRRNILNATNRV